MSLFTKLISALLILATSLNAETWVRGALTLHSVSGEVALSKLGEKAVVLGAGMVPVSMSGLINCEAEYNSSALFSTSNRSYILFEGDGSFAVERFEQVLPEALIWESDTLEASQSRMIVNFRAGNFVMDSRQMLESSQCMIETPLGRIAVKRALWQMRIVFDPRSQIFDFTITCSDGRVRFTDLQGEQYTLRAGQRLSGAGARSEPSIEVGNYSERVREQMQLFRDLTGLHGAAAKNLQAYQAYFEVIDELTSQEATLPDARTDQSTRRPIVIDYAKDPSPVTPFRGEVRPPSDYQADLF